jgi:uncharacterized protein
MLYCNVPIKNEFMKIINFIINIPANITILLIKFYQFFFSFDHSFWAHPENIRVCTYQPSCSQFTLEAIEKHGLIAGSIMGTVRIISCNPWSHGGYDPVADKFTIGRYKGKNAKRGW